MRNASTWIILTYCSFAVAAVSNAQSRKAGLWETKSKTTIGQTVGQTGPSTTPAETPADSESAGIPVCYTQDVIDKYGVILPPSLKDCQLSNVKQTATSYTADMTCHGSYNGRGSVDATWTDEDHVSGKVHFTSRTKEASNPRLMQWTREASGVFKSANCGDVKPRAVMPKPDAKPDAKPRTAGLHP